MKTSTTIFSATAAFISGTICCKLFVTIAGYLAAIAIPREYFLWFGRDHVHAALFVLDILTFVLPYFVIGLAWGILTSLALRTRPLSTSLWCGLGCLLVMIVLIVSDGPGIAIYIAGLKDLNTLLQSLLNLIAGPFGILVGGYILYKLRRRKSTT